jgi:DHA1 family multidrug resistance protein-like MFS transporter
MNMGFYALIPYLSLYLTDSFAWTMAMTGFLLGVRQLSQQGLTFLGGMIADRIGLKKTLVFGVFIRGIGFFSFGICTEVWQFFAAAIISGIGGALFEPSFQAAFARLSPKEHRKALFSFKNVITNVGMIGSTLVGGLLSSIDFFYLSLFSGLLFIIIGIICSLNLPRIKVEVTNNSWVQDIGYIITDIRFVIYTVILIGYYYLFMQMFLTIPKLAENLLGNSKGVAYAYATISLSVILGQMQVAKWLNRYTNRLTWIGIGSLVMGMGLFLFSFAPNLPILLIFCTIFALGTMIAGPIIMDVVPMLAPRNKLASYYGFNGYSLAIGGALSTTAGGWFYDLGSKYEVPYLPWLICLLVAVFVLLGLIGLERKYAKEKKYRSGIIVD